MGCILRNLAIDNVNEKVNGSIVSTSFIIVLHKSFKNSDRGPKNAI